jgi:hypothetical protein
VLGACIVLGAPLPGWAQRGGASHGGSGRPQQTTGTDDADIIAQLDEALRLVQALQAQSAQLRAEVVRARSARAEVFQAIANAQAGMEDNLQAIIRIGRELLARAAP